MTARTDQTENDSTPTGTEHTVGMEGYFEFFRLQMDLHRKFTITWAAAVTSMSTAVLGQWQAAEHIVAGHAEKLAERAHGAERVTRGIAEQVETAAERTLGSLTDEQPATLTPSNHREATKKPSGVAMVDAATDNVKMTPDIFDELLELIIDEDIKAAIP